MVRCVLCGKEFKAITGSHVKRHNLSLKEYEVLVRRFGNLVYMLNRYRGTGMERYVLKQIGSVFGKEVRL